MVTTNIRKEKMKKKKMNWKRKGDEMKSQGGKQMENRWTDTNSTMPRFRHAYSGSTSGIQVTESSLEG